MRSIVLISAISLGSGCAGGVSQAPTTPSAPVATADDTAAQEREDERIRELRAQLALANARSAELEAQATGVGSDTVTIGASDETSEGLFSDDEGWDQPAERLPPRRAREARASRPVLRLYGVPQAPPLNTTIPQGLPALPYGSSYRPVTTTPPTPTPSVVPTNERLPWENAPAAASRAPAPTGSVNAPERIDLGLEAYRTALGMLRARRFAESMVAFERFEQAHPTHPQVANARYWRAELYYIQRQYGQARTAFESYVGRYPRGRRVADALLKLSLCSRRLGNAREAEAHMERLRRDFPSSDAARLASREVN